MAIYRGPGGSGDATADSANTAQLAQTYANQAISSANAAASSATNASNSASAASSSASTASTAATNAQTAETNAETAETNAEAAQTAAEAARDASINLANNFAVTATTLSAGSSATASYNSGTYTLTLGIPTGATGATGSTGATGAQGPEGLKWLGAYAGGTSYVVDDAVSYNGSSYICKLASTGNLPTNTTYWDTLAEKGASGSGAGDVTGPSSAVANNFVAFDGITGKLIKDSTYSSSSFAKYGDTTANFTGTLQNGGHTVLTTASDYLDSTDIGSTVQAYDADLTTLGAGGSSARSFLGLAIGTDVQGYDAQLSDIAGLTPTDNGVIIGNGTNFVVESGATLKTSLGLTIGTDVQAYDSNLTSFVNTFTLPTTDGTTGQVLQTNGSGTLSFASASGGITTGKAIAMAIVFGG
jgi:hypothetical protein